MTSRWKCVDLLSLSSVTAAAVRRQRRQPSAPPASPFGFQASSTSGASILGRDSDDQADPGQRDHTAADAADTDATSFRDAWPARGCCVDMTVGSAACLAARVSPAAAAATTATRVSISRLLCSSLLPWHSALDCFYELAEGERRRRADASSLYDTHCPQTHDHIIPLEAIIAVYGMLLRQQAPHTAADKTDYRDASSRSAAVATASQSTVSDTTLASGGAVSPLVFMAYASKQHSSLNPIAVLLAADKSRGTGDVSEPQDGGGVHEDAHGGASPLSLLTLSTALHVGLLEELQISAVPPSSSSTAAVPATGTAPTTPSLTRQRWAAAQTIHHMWCYGWAPDYFRALAATPLPATASASATVTTTLGDRHGESADRVSVALGLVQRAAHAMPHFTHLLCAVESMWAIHHERRCAGASGQPSLPAGAAERCQQLPLNASRQDKTSALAGYTQTRAVNSVAGEASVKMLHALAATSPRERLGSAAVSGDAVRDVSHTVTTRQLHSVTRDLVVFAWNAIEVRRRRAVGVAGRSENYTAAPYRRSPTGASGSGLESSPDLIGSGISRQLECAVAMADEEQDALLRLVCTATRFSTFKNLCGWMAPLVTHASCVSAEVADGPSRSSVWSPQQEEALLCLLTRTVRRAPSWTAACTILSDTWSKLPRVSAAADVAGTGAHTDLRCRRDDGVASVPELLEAFFTSPHAPKAVLPSQVRRQAGCRPTTCDASFWYRVIVCTDTAEAEVTHWRYMIFGGDAYVYSTGFSQAQRTAAMEKRHHALTRAALLVVHRWLRPAEALNLALQCLARSHARCAEQWTTVLECQPNDGKASDSTTHRRCPENGNAKTTNTPDVFPYQQPRVPSSCPGTAATLGEGAVDVVPATVTRLMADQHRAYCGALLSNQEQLEWLDATLRCTRSGPARQLIIKAALMARWHCGSDVQNADESAPGDGGSGSNEDLAARVCAAMNYPMTVAVTEMTAIVRRWVSPEADVFEESAVAALFNCGDDLPRRVARLGDVGRLLTDVSRVFHSVPSGPSAVEALFAAARAAVTSAGLRLECGAHLSSSSSLFSTAATAAAQLSAGVSAQPGDSVAAAVALSRSALVPERQPCGDIERRLARLHGWLELLCTCPTELLAHEHCVVVWLYVLMRHVEELHGYAQEGSAQLSAAPRQEREASIQAESEITSCRAEAASDGGGVDLRQCQWSLETEEAAVRRVAQSLSSQLWPVLPTSSLLPPMLLNWLLTRGGERTWGDAVRTLRAWADADGGLKEEHSGRRFSLLVLPLNRVVSVEQAVRVLHTLQAVEERCAASPTPAETVSMKRTPSPQIPLQKFPSRFSVTKESGVTLLVAEMGSLPAMTDHRNRQPLDTIALASVYGHIEYVVLREWYGRALAAVLRFLAQQPQYTYLTYVRDAPHYAVPRVLQRQHDGHRASDLTETEGWTGKAPMEVAIHSVRTLCARRPTHSLLQALWGTQGVGCNRALGAPASVEPVTHAEISLARWRAWMSEAAALAKVDHGILFPPSARTLSTDSPAFTCASAAAVADHVWCTSNLNSLTMSSFDASAPSKVMQTPLHDGSSPSAVAAPSSSAVRVPLHLLATFVLQECRISSPHGGPSMSGAASAVARAENVSRAPWKRKRRSFFGKHRSPFSAFLPSAAFLNMFMDEDVQRSFTGSGTALTAASPSPCRARTVHSELLALFLQVLRCKQREAAAHTGASAAAGETLEELAAEVLAEQCFEEVVMELREDKEQQVKGGGDRTSG
ncbi:hypothetical protein, unknown function [Leishmania tarentolae]|uniref:Uncharacterized protein n=1 Tax=Leishmania tarentolae TaxID=5689 RepID=A0A640KBS9_LEITA|nr:hypothetical protein, unknown function [Leishmania tarentolae]